MNILLICDNQEDVYDPKKILSFLRIVFPNHSFRLGEIDPAGGCYDTWEKDAPEQNMQLKQFKMSNFLFDKKALEGEDIIFFFKEIYGKAFMELWDIKHAKGTSLSCFEETDKLQVRTEYNSEQGYFMKKPAIYLPDGISAEDYKLWTLNAISTAIKEIENARTDGNTTGK